MKNFIIASITCMITISCNESFLDEKPNSEIVLINNMNDIMALLENSYVMNVSGGLAQVSADEYIIPNDKDYYALSEPIARNAYIWEENLYEDVRSVNDWNHLYRTIFYANSVLYQLENIQEDNLEQKRLAKGWALFARAFSFYELVINFCEQYDAAKADKQKGIPIRTSPAVDYLEGRSSLALSYEQILQDLSDALPLLNDRVILGKTNQPSKAAVYALLARIYLNRSEYEKAESYADSCLMLQDDLIDYNTVSVTSITPFSIQEKEVIYYASQILVSDRLTGASTLNRPYTISDDLLALYTPTDLRFQIFFRLNTLGFYNSKRRYTSLSTPFSGLATDEIILIKAECAARRGDMETAKIYLNKLLVNRHKKGEFVPVDRTGDELINIILRERQKELVWRGTRWQDLKRLNREGYNILLRRTVNGNEYTLKPNSSRYVFPIPPDELDLSGIEQNERRDNGQ